MEPSRTMQLDLFELNMMQRTTRHRRDLFFLVEKRVRLTVASALQVNVVDWFAFFAYAQPVVMLYELASFPFG